MSIKCDKWIRRMAEEGMISPFESGQVREIDGRKVISLRNIELRLRCAMLEQFKLFTNLNSPLSIRRASILTRSLRSKVITA